MLRWPFQSNQLNLYLEHTLAHELLSVLFETRIQKNQEQVIENLKDALGFIEQGEWQMYESPWKNNKEVQKYIDDALEWTESSLEMLQYKLEEE